MAKKRKVARKSKKAKSSVVDPKARAKVRDQQRVEKRKRDEHEKLSLAHGVISGAYAGLVEQFHPDGYDEQRLAKKSKTKAKAKKKVARKAKAKKKAAPKRKVKTRRKK